MYIVQATNVFDKWFEGLRDFSFQERIQKRINRIKLGNFGDAKSVGGGVYELRMTFGPGFRIYYIIRGNTIVILLCGGDKSSQQKDIQHAKEFAQEV